MPPVLVCGAGSVMCSFRLSMYASICAVVGFHGIYSMQTSASLELEMNCLG